MTTLFERFSEVKVKFKFYYKYRFFYEGTLPDGKHIICGVGGGEDIYHFEVNADEEVAVWELEPSYLALYDGEALLEEQDRD